MRHFISKLIRSKGPNLKKYATANKKIVSITPEEKRIVFFGDSITELWKKIDSNFFAGKHFVNRGISGQTTTQMLARFHQDVIDLKPAIVVILAGTNDIAENTGPITLENIFANIVSMAEMAKQKDIHVILSSVLPVAVYPWRKHLEPIEKISILNEWIREYADKNNILYVDYYSAMIDSNKGLDKRFSADGVHPGLAGYKIMAPLVENAIRKILNKI